MHPAPVEHASKSDSHPVLHQQTMIQSPDILEFDQAEYFDNVKRPSYARLLEEEAIL